MAALGVVSGKYRVSWECAELLIELGGGAHDAPAPAVVVAAAAVAGPPTSVSAPAMQQQQQRVQEAPGDRRKSRERAITLAAGDDPPPPTPTPTTAADPANLAWRASTGRRQNHELSQRQLVILREMLNNPEGTLRIPEEDGVDGGGGEGVGDGDGDVDRAWRWGDAMNSTVTLRSEESTSAARASAAAAAVVVGKKRRGSRMRMGGLREMLKALRRSLPEQQQQQQQQKPAAVSASDASASTESSIGDGHPGEHYYEHPHIPVHRRRTKTSIGPAESIRSARNQGKVGAAAAALAGEPSITTTHRSSPRRPSLASIFRFGQKSKTSLSAPDTSVESIGGEAAAGEGDGDGGGAAGKLSDRSSTMEEEDWDRMDSASDLEHAQALEPGDAAMSTVKGKNGRSPYLQEQQQQQQELHGLRPAATTTQMKMGPLASRSSIFGELSSAQQQQHPRSARLSNVEENVGDHRGSTATRKGNKRASLPAPSPSVPRSSRPGLKSDSVRSAPPQPASSSSSTAQDAPPRSISDFKLAMTPENIKPLLENTREVHAKLNECVAEMRVLVASAKG